MNLIFLNRIKNIIDLKNVKVDQKVLIFLFFFFISTIFWFLNALSREYISDVKYPVRYINFPADKILVNELPKRFIFKVESHGYNLLKYKIRPAILPVVFNINSYPLMQVSDNSNKFYILTNYNKQNIENQLSSDLRLLDIKPDSLYFELADLISKKVMVKPNVEVVLNKPFMIKSSITSIPDSIIIKGPNSILDSINEVHTKFQKFKNIEQSVVKSISLVSIENVIFSPKKVDINIPIEQFTESKIIVPITVSNLPDTLTLKTFPSHVEITYLVALSDFNSITPDLFKVNIDYNSLGEIDEDHINIEVSEYPSYIKAMRYTPQKVEYIIEK